jgi:ATP-dependent Clp protease ATP-binding subunit ClpC
MPKINVYLPDDLADAVRETGIPVSPICQRALEQAVRRADSVRSTVLDELDTATLAEHLPSFTARAVTVLGLAIDRAKSARMPNVTTGDLLYGLLTERANLAGQVLGAMEVEPSTLTAPEDPEPSLDTERTGLRFSRPAATVMELTVGEAIGLGHNYVGCEHLLIGLAAEPGGAAGTLLRSRGVDGRGTRRAVAAAVAGYGHLRANQGAATGIATAIRAELAPLVERIERLEARA